MSILGKNAITKSVFFNMGLTPPLFLTMFKKIADLVKRYIPYHDGHLQMDGPL